MTLDLDEDGPHPSLVAAVRPSPGQVTAAAQVLGWYPADPFLCPAVPAQPP